MARVIPLDELRFSPTAALFEGGDEIDASIFVVNYERGNSVGQHTHPYAEAFVVVTGTASFLVDGERLEVGAGNVVVVPAETPHGFEGAGEDSLTVVSVHPRGKVEQTFL